MASLSLNKVVLCGRLTAEPELKQTQSGIPVVSFTLAINRRYVSRANDSSQQQADFINLVAWRQTAEFISKFFRKGASICVTGSLQSRSWTDNQGQKRYATEVVVDEAMFVDSRTDNNGGALPSYSGTQGYTPDAYGASSFSSPVDPKFEEIKTDDDLPF